MRAELEQELADEHELIAGGLDKAQELGVVDEVVEPASDPVGDRRRHRGRRSPPRPPRQHPPLTPPTHSPTPTQPTPTSARTTPSSRSAYQNPALSRPPSQRSQP